MFLEVICLQFTLACLRLRILLYTVRRKPELRCKKGLYCADISGEHINVLSSVMIEIKHK